MGNPQTGHKYPSEGIFHPSFQWRVILLCDTTFNHSAEKKSFANTRTVDDIECDTFKGTCRALELLEDDTLWYYVVEDAALQQIPKQMRALFIMIMTYTEVIDSKSLVEGFYEPMYENFQRKLLPPYNANQNILSAVMLIDLPERFHSPGKKKI